MGTVLLISFHCKHSHAEVVLSYYGGAALTDDNDLKLHQPGGTSLTFHDVSWSDQSFESPYYYGARLTYWLVSKPRWGAAVDFTHAKIYLDLSDTVHVMGKRDGVSVNDRERVGDTFERFNLSHGHNFFTVNLMYRWFPKGKRDESLLGRLQPYVGVGAGAAYPHVETTIDGVKTDEYQLAGPAVKGMVGLNYDLWKHLSTFVEYKLIYADLDLDLKGGGSVQTETVTHNLAFGISVGF